MTLGSNAFIHLILCSSNFILLLLARPTYIDICIFSSSPQKLLTFHAQFNKCPNKQKQTLSGEKWHESILARSFPHRSKLIGSRSCTRINFEHFTFDNKDILKNRPFLLLSMRQHFEQQPPAGCNHALQ